MSQESVELSFSACLRQYFAAGDAAPGDVATALRASWSYDRQTARIRGDLIGGHEGGAPAGFAGIGASRRGVPRWRYDDVRGVHRRRTVRSSRLARFASDGRGAGQWSTDRSAVAGRCTRMRDGKAVQPGRTSANRRAGPQSCGAGGVGDVAGAFYRQPHSSLDR